MALKQDCSFSGIDLHDGFIKVASAAGDKQGLNVQIDYSASVGSGSVQTKSVFFVPSMTGCNFIAQAYQHLKSLPKFEGAEDC